MGWIESIDGQSDFGVNPLENQVIGHELLEYAHESNPKESLGIYQVLKWDDDVVVLLVVEDWRVRKESESGVPLKQVLSENLKLLDRLGLSDAPELFGDLVGSSIEPNEPDLEEHHWLGEKDLVMVGAICRMGEVLKVKQLDCLAHPKKTKRVKMGGKKGTWSEGCWSRFDDGLWVKIVHWESPLEFEAIRN